MTWNTVFIHSLVFLPKHYWLPCIHAHKHLYQYSKTVFLIMYMKNVLQDKSQLHVFVLHSQSFLIIETMDLLKYSHVSSILYQMQCWHKLYWAYRPYSIGAAAISLTVAIINFVIKFKGNRVKPLWLSTAKLRLYIRRHYCSKIYVWTTQ